MENFDRIDWENDKSIEQGLESGGITFNVAYAGYIEIKHSVKSLDRDLRNATACECISRIDDYVTKKKAKKRKLDKGIRDFIADKPITDYSGSRVIFTISAERFDINLMMYNEILARHDLTNISFASIGEGEMSHYIGYVGTDACDLRACYILDCGANRARRVIKAIHTVFQMRCRKFCNESTRKITTYRRVKPVQVVPDLYAPQPQAPVRESKVDFDRFRLQNEIWYHGVISDESAMELLKYYGDFLVRETSSPPNQLILSCFNGEHQHFQLADSAGKVRTRNRDFESIHEFIDYHFRNNAPIVCPNGSTVLLSQPIISEAC